MTRIILQRRELISVRVCFLCSVWRLVAILPCLLPFSAVRRKERVLNSLTSPWQAKGVALNLGSLHNQRRNAKMQGLKSMDRVLDSKWRRFMRHCHRSEDFRKIEIASSRQRRLVGFPIDCVVYELIWQTYQLHFTGAYFFCSGWCNTSL